MTKDPLRVGTQVLHPQAEPSRAAPRRAVMNGGIFSGTTCKSIHIYLSSTRAAPPVRALEGKMKLIPMAKGKEKEPSPTRKAWSKGGVFFFPKKKRGKGAHPFLGESHTILLGRNLLKRACRVRNESGMPDYQWLSCLCSDRGDFCKKLKNLKTNKYIKKPKEAKTVRRRGTATFSRSRRGRYSTMTGFT